MGTETQVVRTEQLPHLAAFCRALAEALRRAGVEQDGVFVVFHESVAAECLQCGAHVPGEELFVLSQPEADSDMNTDLRRLRLGYCAKAGCNSLQYRLSFGTRENLNWHSCLTQADRFLRRGKAIGRTSRIEAARRLLILLVVVALLFLLRQLYYGGRIPLIREPEEFRVDPFPAQYEPAR